MHKSSIEIQGNDAKHMLCDAMRKEMLIFVLKNTSVRRFNLAIKQFNNQLLWRFLKTEIVAQYPEFAPKNGYYTELNILMTDILRPFTCEEVKCSDLRYKIDALERTLNMYQKLHPTRCALIKERNILVNEYNELLKPQNELIKLYKKVHKDNSNNLGS